jgi:guanylate kinase
MQPGKLFLIVGPSGVGKGTLVNALREKHPEFYFPPSATTRKPREGEKDGQQYLFFSEVEFEKLESEGGFIETALIHQTEKYGTLRKPILEAIEASKIVIREVDIQGLVSITASLDRDLFSAIFVAPPDKETLRKRILHRQPDMAEEELARRLESADKEIAQKNLADFEVISEDNEIPAMVAKVEGIIEGIRNKE